MRPICNRHSTHILQDGETVLMTAASYGNLELVKLLIQHPKTDVNIKNWVSGNLSFEPGSLSELSYIISSSAAKTVCIVPQRLAMLKS